MTNEDFDDFEDDDLDDSPPLDLEDIRKKIPTYPSTQLCEMIVCNRYFGCFKEIAIMCMEELAQRRINGDVYDFETYIDESFNTLPKLDLTAPDLGEVLRQVIGRKINK